jgi:CheY-like chemotaxis protein
MDEDNKSKKILVVDDEPGVLEIYSEVLKDAGFTVDTASNGNEALQKAAEKAYDLILLDIMMENGPNGLECLKTFKSSPDKYKKAIIVMLTNLALTNTVKEAFDYGAEGYLIKLTLSNEQIVNKVKGYLNGFSEK